ncbi:MAG TPA: DUF2628 domain-containing protein [Xanthobacteraceae bacterium]|jgi:hypothetical protein|nr:DUF2628 domain-containing protein [Xanthobacteraceae bacterium]
MPVYTVHEPPVRTPGALADPARFAFVRDGFYWWAFLLTPLWMLWRQLWLVLVLYLVISIGLETAMRVYGASGGMISLVAILISLLVGLEAGTLRRFTMKRRRWKNVGVVSGSDLEDAEQRFFAAWVRRVPSMPAPPDVPPSAPPPTTPTTPMASYLTMPATQPQRTPYSSGVIGLFPEPGAQR